MMRISAAKLLWASSNRVKPLSNRLISTSRVVWQTEQNKSRDNKEQYDENQGPPPANIHAWAVGIFVGGVIFARYLHTTVNGEQPVKLTNDEIFESAGKRRDGLPQYRKSEVSVHDDDTKRIWVTYKHGVYDITDFVSKHPGAKNILMAAGGSLEPFWNLYAVHKDNAQVYQLLEEYRIGNLDMEDVKENEKLAAESDPYLMEPKKRNPGLLVKSQRPFNAETPLEVLAKHFYTPNDWFYVRNHLPTPDVSAKEYELDVSLEDGKGEKVFKLDDLKTKFQKVEVTSAIQCGGNRRAEMNEIKPIKGLMWKGGAIGNAKWGGVRLSDVLKDYDLTGIKHVQFEGYDEGSDGSPYGASIPIEKAMSGSVILAYEMNGETLPRDHGFPVRVVATGIVGARNVKWLRRIVLSHEESHSHWQRSDYKGFNPSIDWSNVDFSKSPAIQNMPVTSVICSSRLNKGKLELNGYAWAGGGNRVIRVDLTMDGGKTWFEGKIDQQADASEPGHFGWSLWSASVPVDKKAKEVEVWCKAVDSNYNSQPESFNNIWNLRGVNSNAYHRVKVAAS